MHSKSNMFYIKKFEKKNKKKKMTVSSNQRDISEAWGYCQLDNIERLKAICPSKVSVDASTKSYEAHAHTLLMSAATHGSINCLQYLLENKADVNKKNMFGYTALHWAAYSGRTECVDELLKYGAKLESKTGDGQTPLHIAASRGHVKFLDYLVQKGADINAVNSDGWTLMHYAVIGNHQPVVKYLVSKNINYKAPDANLKTIDSLVEEYGRTWFSSLTH